MSRADDGVGMDGSETNQCMWFMGEKRSSGKIGWKTLISAEWSWWKELSAARAPRNFPKIKNANQRSKWKTKNMNEILSSFQIANNRAVRCVFIQLIWLLRWSMLFSQLVPHILFLFRYGHYVAGARQREWKLSRHHAATAYFGRREHVCNLISRFVRRHDALLAVLGNACGLRHVID